MRVRLARHLLLAVTSSCVTVAKHRARQNLRKEGSVLGLYVLQAVYQLVGSRACGMGGIKHGNLVT